MIRILFTLIVFGSVILLVFVLIRFGSMKYQWVKLEKNEIKMLKEEHKRYMQSRLPSKPTGKPLYRKGMYTINGVIVHESGLFAKFAVGAKGKYRFVTFMEISDIYPVRMDNPLTRQDSKWLGLSSWKGIQVETVSNMVLLIDSRKHDFDAFIPILKKAMGGRWDSVYHPEEVIWGNFLEGDILVHKSVRTRRPGYVPAKLSGTRDPSAPAEPTPVSNGKGRLLLEESQQDIEAKRRSYVRGSLALLVVGMVAIAIGVLGHFFTTFFGTFLLPFMILVSVASFVLGAFLMAVKDRITPLRIYENGFEAPLLMPGKTIFISFGEIIRTTERKNPIDGELLVYQTAKPNQMVGVRKNMLGFDRVKDHIRSRIGRSEFIVEIEPTPEQAEGSKKVEYVLYATGLLFGIIASLVMTLVIFWGQSMMLFLWGIGISLPPITMISITAFVGMMRRMEKVVPKRLNVKIPATMIVTLLVFSFAVNGLGLWETTTEALPGEAPELIEAEPGSSFFIPGQYENVGFSVNDDIFVDSGQTLHFQNSTLVMNQSHDRELRIWIAEGGTLILENTSIESSYHSFGYTFEIMGTCRIVSSHISDVWGDLDVNDDGGIEVYSDDVIIESSIITESRANGILVKNSSPVIANNTIVNIEQDGIETRNSGALILNNTVDSCGWAMIIYHRSEPLIEGNVVRDNENGIWIGASDPVIEDNEFYSNRNYAISYDENSNPTIRGNTYAQNDVDVIYDEPSPTFQLCFIVNVGIAVAGLLVLFFVYKEGLKAEKGRLDNL